MMKILQIIKIMERFLLLSFLVLVLGFNSGCSNDGTNSTPSGAGGAGGAGGTSEPAAPTTVSGQVGDDGFHVWLNAPAGGDGSSWGQAYSDLQAAIEAAYTHTTKKKVYVAVGTYKPTGYPNGGEGNERAKCFSLRDMVEVRGGYSGQGNDRSTDPSKTILSGDINNTPDDISDDVYHVFNHDTTHDKARWENLGDTTKLIGVTITKGNANGIGYTARGGGLNAKGSLRLENIIFRENHASENPGIGGGVYFYYGSNPTLFNVKFINNHAVQGGGMYFETSSPTLENVEFTNNTGAAIYNINDSTLTITNVTFKGNKGGNILTRGRSKVVGTPIILD